MSRAYPLAASQAVTVYDGCMDDHHADAGTQPADTNTMDPVEGPGPAAIVEAVILASERPVSSAKLAAAIDTEAHDVNELVASLNESYAKDGRSFRIEPMSGGFRMMTLPEYAGAIGSVRKAGESTRLSRAALEVLAIVAYKQPMTRAKIEAIRGVGCGEVLRSLLERRLLRISGRAEEIGRPMLYSTTREFLSTFGLASLADLPRVEDFGPEFDA